MYKQIRLIFFFVVMGLQVRAQYTGTASVTQGLATLTQSNLYICTGGRVTNVGTITATDNTVWTVPASTLFTQATTPFASDLYNGCNGHTYANTNAALQALGGSDVQTVDADGEIISAFIFADNYFELFINGQMVGKDRVPYTPFNSSIIRFRVKRPFSIAFHLVDWEEHLGLGAEASGGFAYHNGDGGLVAIFKDAANAVVAKTDASWKAQTFYTAPIQNLSCPSENGTLRLSGACSTADVQDGTSFYALHWPLPASCFDANFADSDWPNATVYSNADVGVNNKPAYTNFTDLFDAVGNDAEFIWSTNLILDNEVVVRHFVPENTGIEKGQKSNSWFRLSPNPVAEHMPLKLEFLPGAPKVEKLRIDNALGVNMYETSSWPFQPLITGFPQGTYFITIWYSMGRQTTTFIVL